MSTAAGKSVGVIGSGRPPRHSVLEKKSVPAALQYGMKVAEEKSSVKEKPYHLKSYEEQMEVYYTSHGLAIMKHYAHLPPSNLVLNLEEMAANSKD